MNTEELRNKIREANIAYRQGKPIMSDEKYDSLLELLPADDPIHSEIGHIDTTDSRKEKLPFRMASMNKLKNIDDYKDWLRLKGIPETTELIITPKYDGLSLLVEEETKKAWTRGNGEVGQNATDHYAVLNCQTEVIDIYSFGEVIISRKNFEKYKDDFANARNLVAGKMNDKYPSKILEDCDYIRFGLKNGKKRTKKEELDTLNTYLNKVQVPYLVIKTNQISESLLADLFKKWNEDYEIDGLIIEVNDHKLREELGTETSSGNPCYARAFKGDIEEVKETAITSITWQVSKQGFLKPVVHIVPVKLDGATVSNVTGNNARFIFENEIGQNAVARVKRSGMVIPQFVEILKAGENGLVKECPICQSDVKWNENQIELVCTNPDCEGQQLQKLIAFFKIMKVENVSEGTVEDFFARGYTTIKDILNISQEEMSTWYGWGKRSAEIVYNSIRSKLSDVSLERVQHASGLFYGLGSKKLALVNHLENTTVEEIVQIEGFSYKSAEIYLKGLSKFKEWISELPITIKSKEETQMKSTGQKCNGWAVVFTGFRSEELSDKIVAEGGEMKSGVSKNATHLVMKEKGLGTSKERKAIELGLEIMDIQELEQHLS
jgi:NAD-dependent DNA ligase